MVNQRNLVFVDKIAYSELIVTGGINAESSAELYDISTNNHCRLPDLPDQRQYHTQVFKL